MASNHSEMSTRATLSSTSNTTCTAPDLDKWRPSHRERELLKLTWSDDFDFLYDLGANIYVYIFEHAPQTRSLFPAFTVHGDGWRDSKEFRVQALKFVQTLSQTVVRLHDMDSLKQLLNDVGRAHVRFAARGFRPEHWGVFRDAMSSALAGHMAALPTLTDQDRAEAVQVWHVLSDYIVYQMRKGFNDGLAMNGDKKKTGSSSRMT